MKGFLNFAGMPAGGWVGWFIGEPISFLHSIHREHGRDRGRTLLHAEGGKTAAAVSGI